MVLAIQPASSHIPASVVWAFGAVAVAGAYGMLAPLLHWWPWHRRTGNPEMNRLIRNQFRGVKLRRLLRRILRRTGEEDGKLVLTSSPSTTATNELSDADRTRIARDTEARIARTIHDPMLRALDARNKGVEAEEAKRGLARPTGYERCLGQGDGLVRAITQVKLRSLSVPDVVAEDAVADLTAQVESWRGEVGGYILPKLDKGWRTSLAQLKLYVEKELAAMRVRQGEQ